MDLYLLSAQFGVCLDSEDPDSSDMEFAPTPGTGDSDGKPCNFWSLGTSMRKHELGPLIAKSGICDPCEEIMLMVFLVICFRLKINNVLVSKGLNFVFVVAGSESVSSPSSSVGGREGEGKGEGRGVKEKEQVASDDGKPITRLEQSYQAV